MKEWGKLRKIVNRGREYENPKKYLVICLFAGHGMIQSGTQVLLTNEYDETKQFHKFIMAEQCMRSLACANENVYIIGLFACCRQIYNPAIHCNMVSKAKAEELSQGFRNIARKLAQFFDKKLG